MAATKASFGIVFRISVAVALCRAVILPIPTAVGFTVPVGRSRPTFTLDAFRSTRSETSSRLFSEIDSTTEEDITTTNESPPVRVQRKYETFLWMHDAKEYDINYRMEGPVDGPPILLIHGFGANVNHYRYQFPALVNEGYRVYAIDLIGFGASDKPADVPYSIELFVSLLIDFVDTVKSDENQPWIVAGNSIGGLCALSLADQLPKIIQGVVLFNCAGGMSGFRYADLPLLLRPVLYFVQKVVLGPSMGGSGFFENFKTRENVESILTEQGVYRNTTNVDEELMEILLGPSDDEGAEQVFLKVFAGPPGPTPESLLPTIQAPILALWGGDDPWTPVDKGMHPGNEFGRYAESDFRLEVIAGAGHCPHDEEPDKVHAIMIPWLEEIRKEYNPQ